MKNCMLLFCMLSLAFFSCQDEEPVAPTNNSVELSKVIKFDNLTNSTIAVEKDGKVKLQVADEKIMSIFDKFVNDYELDFKSQSFKIVNIDNKNYLRFYGEKNQVATIELIKGENHTLRTGSTVCKSTACSSGGGCVRDWCILYGMLQTGWSSR